MAATASLALHAGVRDLASNDGLIAVNQDAGTALSFVLPPHGARVFAGRKDD